MLLCQGDTLNHISKLHLFVARELRKANAQQFLVDSHGRLFSETCFILLFIVSLIPIQERST